MILFLSAYAQPFFISTNEIGMTKVVGLVQRISAVR